ncbi:MAG: MBL fold metallo-hydrolase [Candidatus Aminicenantes bacterium]|nr:MAG: MBL fold metallo-hydrolase [Candidatus Aminicenantes bacterium]
MGKKFFLVIFLMMVTMFFLSAGEKKFEKEVIKTNEGPLEITFIGHGSVMLTFKQMTIHVDPFSRIADYSQLPKADLVLITHHHGDHLDPSAVKHIRTETTRVILSQKCSEKVSGGIIMANGDVKTVKGLKIEAVPAYNILHKRSSGEPFHPKGEGNGYVIALGDKRVYVGGDTENIPEMKQLTNIDIAFLPMNLPYTMTPEMVVDAVNAFKPKILFPYHYHFGDTDIRKLENLMKNVEGVDLRIHNRR